MDTDFTPTVGASVPADFVLARDLERLAAHFARPLTPADPDATMVGSLRSVSAKARLAKARARQAAKNKRRF